MNIKEKIEQELEKVRPSLQADGGDVNFISYNPETGLVEVQLLGHCAVCPYGQITLKQGIEQQLTENIPEVKRVEAV